MRTELATLHGEECDLLVLGATLFAVAVAWHAASAGLRVVLAADGDLPSAATCRGRTWVEAAPVCGGDPKAFAAALAEREALLRAAPPFVRPAPIAVATAAPAAARRCVRDLLRVRRSTLPPARLTPEGMVEGFDGVSDDVALARAVAAAAAARGARIVVHAACIAASGQGVALRQRGGGEARLRTRHVLLAMDEAPEAVAAALHAALRGEWTTTAEARAVEADAKGGAVAASAAGANVVLAVPLHRHTLRRRLGFADEPPAPSARLVRRASATRAASAPTVAGELHEWPWPASAPFAAAAAFVAAQWQAHPLDLRAIGAGAAEPTDRLWRQHGARASQVRRRCLAAPFAAQPLCPHRPTLAGEVVFALADDGALGFGDVLRRLDPDGVPCLEPDCLAAAHAVFLRHRTAVVDDDPTGAIAAFDPTP